MGEGHTKYNRPTRTGNSYVLDISKLRLSQRPKRGTVTPIGIPIYDPVAHAEVTPEASIGDIDSSLYKKNPHEASYQPKGQRNNAYRESTSSEFHGANNGSRRTSAWESPEAPAIGAAAQQSTPRLKAYELGAAPKLLMKQTKESYPAQEVPPETIAMWLPAWMTLAALHGIPALRTALQAPHARVAILSPSLGAAKAPGRDEARAS